MRLCLHRSCFARLHCGVAFRLYYRVLNVREEAGQPARPFCFEVEDTFDCTRTDEGRDIRRLMDMKRKIRGCLRRHCVSHGGLASLVVRRLS